MQSFALIFLAGFACGTPFEPEKVTEFAITPFSTTPDTFRTTQNVTIPDPPLVEFFIDVVLDKVIGARFCKNDFDCGVGLQCNPFWKLCAPVQEINFIQSIEPASCLKDLDCPDMHFCINATCKFCGPTTCHTNQDCCSGLSSNITYGCVNLEHLEKHSVAQQLGRPVQKGHSHSDEVESSELLTFGPTAQGDRIFHQKRCWSRCATEADCQFSGFPEALQGHFTCCNGFCTRKSSCVTVPSNFAQATTPTSSTFTTVTVKNVKKLKTQKKH